MRLHPYARKYDDILWIEKYKHATPPIWSQAIVIIEIFSIKAYPLQISITPISCWLRILVAVGVIRFIILSQIFKLGTVKRISTYWSRLWNLRIGQFKPHRYWMNSVPVQELWKWKNTTEAGEQQSQIMSNKTFGGQWTFWFRFSKRLGRLLLAIELDGQSKKNFLFCFRSTISSHESKIYLGR